MVQNKKTFFISVFKGRLKAIKNAAALLVVGGDVVFVVFCLPD